MSQIASGIVYPIRLGTAQLQADLSGAESLVAAHVARMNQMSVSIPVTLDLTGFNAAAQQINAQLAAWQSGVNIGIGGAGGIGGGNITGSFNSLAQTSQITNYFQQLTQNISTINNAVNQAANAASTGGGGGFGGGRGLGRVLGAYAFLREGEQILRNEERYSEATYKAHGDPTAIAEAELRHRTDYDSFAFGVGRIGRFVREFGSSDVTSQDLEHEIQDNARADRRITETRRIAERTYSLQSQAEIAATPEGYQREIKQREESLKAENVKIEQDPAVAATRARIEHDRQFAEDQAKARKYDDQGNWQARDAQGNQIVGMSRVDQLRQADIDLANREAKNANDKLDAEVDRQKAAAKSKSDSELADARQKSAYATAEATTREARDSAILSGANPEQADIGARRADDAQKAAKYARELPANEAAARTAADKAATDLAEDSATRRRTQELGSYDLRAATSGRELSGDGRRARLDEQAGEHRLGEESERDTDKRKGMEAADRAEEAEAQDKFNKDEERREAEAVNTIAEIRSRAFQSQLRQAGMAQAAELEQFDEAQTQKIAKLNETINAEQDASQKRRVIAERDAQLDAQKIERMEFVADQARKFASDRAEEAIKLAHIQAEAAQYALHAQGLTWQESQDRFKASWDERIATATRAVQQARPGSPEEAAARADLAALGGDRIAAQHARDRDQYESNRDLKNRTGEIELRAKGKPLTAELKAITDRADKEFREAAAGPGATEKEQREAAARQYLIRQDEAAQLKLEQHEIGQIGPGVGQAVVGSRTDLSGRLSGRNPQEDTLEVSRNIEQILKTISGKLPTVPVAQ